MRRRLGGPLLFCALVSSAVLSSGGAFAAPDDAKRAEALYDEALALADAGNFAAACPKYAASQKLDPALGTQFNLADCWEHTGQLASAYSLFVAVERAAKAAGKGNLASRAQGRAAALEPRVPRLAINAPPIRQLVVRLDGVILSEDALASAPVDAGRHVIEAAAPGRQAWRQELDVTGGITPVEIPDLSASEASPAAPIVLERRPAKSWRIAGATVAGIGVVGLVLGGVAGANALSKRDEAREVCRNDEPSQCHVEAGVPIWEEAGNAGTISTVAFAAGAALVVTGAVLWILAPSRTVTPTTAFGRLGLGGAF